MRKRLIASCATLILATTCLAACNMSAPGEAEGGGEADGGSLPDISGDAPDPGLPGDRKGGGATADDGAEPAPRGPSGGGEPTPADFAELISSYLDNYAEELAAGYTPAQGLSDEIIGLQAGGEHDWSVRLRRGTDYRIVGACDNECNDVDLILLDAQGREIDSDLLTDDYPIVSVRPESDSRYTVRIRLVTCTIEPCYVGARVLQQ